MKKRQFTAEYKARIVLEVLKEEKTLSEICSREGLANTMVSGWKREFLANAAKVFGAGRDDKAERERIKEMKSREAELMKLVGRLTVDVDYLKKKYAEALGEDWET